MSQDPQDLPWIDNRPDSIYAAMELTRTELEEAASTFTWIPQALQHRLSEIAGSSVPGAPDRILERGPADIWAALFGAWLEARIEKDARGRDDDRVNAFKLWLADPSTSPLTRGESLVREGHQVNPRELWVSRTTAEAKAFAVQMESLKKRIASSAADLKRLGKELDEWEKEQTAKAKAAGPEGIYSIALQDDEISPLKVVALTGQVTGKFTNPATNLLLQLTQVYDSGVLPSGKYASLGSDLSKGLSRVEAAGQALLEVVLAAQDPTDELRAYSEAVYDAFDRLEKVSGSFKDWLKKEVVKQLRENFDTEFTGVAEAFIYLNMAISTINLGIGMAAAAVPPLYCVPVTIEVANMVAQAATKEVIVRVAARNPDMAKKYASRIVATAGARGGEGAELASMAVEWGMVARNAAADATEASIASELAEKVVGHASEAGVHAVELTQVTQVTGPMAYMFGMGLNYLKLMELKEAKKKDSTPLLDGEQLEVCDLLKSLVDQTWDGPAWNLAALVVKVEGGLLVLDDGTTEAKADATGQLISRVSRSTVDNDLMWLRLRTEIEVDGQAFQPDWDGARHITSEVDGENTYEVFGVTVPEGVGRWIAASVKNGNLTDTGFSRNQGAENPGFADCVAKAKVAAVAIGRPAGNPRGGQSPELEMDVYPIDWSTAQYVSGAAFIGWFTARVQSPEAGDFLVCVNVDGTQRAAPVYYDGSAGRFQLVSAERVLEVKAYMKSRHAPRPDAQPVPVAAGGGLGELATELAEKVASVQRSFIKSLKKIGD